MATKRKVRVTKKSACKKKKCLVDLWNTNKKRPLVARCVEDQTIFIMLNLDPWSTSSIGVGEEGLHTRSSYDEKYELVNSLQA